MSEAATPDPRSAASEPPFGVNEMRLTGRHWLVVAALVLAFVALAPLLWARLERFEPGPEYRVPYTLSADYWLYQRRLAAVPADAIPVVGDSVVWGEYVRADGSLSRFLSREAGRPGRFANCGIDGVFPLAIEGLLSHYGGALRSRKALLQCNMLWMSSPRSDLSSDKEETFNHTSLVPQRFGAVPCYRADAAARLGATVARSVGFFGWVSHLNSRYFGQTSLPRWTLQEDGDLPAHPNAWRLPGPPLSLYEPASDPQRGPGSRRHRPWSAGGRSPQSFEWVGLDASLQWAAFRRTVALLRGRGCDVMVVVGPFNEHMVAPEQRPRFRAMRDGIADWLQRSGVAHVVPETLPSALYADASHPLTEGYAELARRLWRDEGFRTWAVR